VTFFRSQFAQTIDARSMFQLVDRLGPIKLFASVPSTLEMMGRRGRCESGDTLSRLLLHCIDGKKCGAKNGSRARRSLIALEDARQVLPTDERRSTQM
jgi:hypothetical protein